MEKLILASASPRRVQLLKQIGLGFHQKISSTCEDIGHDLDPEQYVKHLALVKAQDVAGQLDQGFIIGADTVVVHNGEILGKPIDSGDARRMLKELSGGTHHVISGVALVDAGTGKYLVDHESTKVHFKSLSPREIESYTATGEPMGKAGAYAIQGLGAVLVEGIEGCYNNVVGLPITKLIKMLRDFGVDIWEGTGEGKPSCHQSLSTTSRLRSCRLIKGPGKN
ncbi:MAG: septum formation inhibitor Maf [Clostridia bacterium]|nr:septum formation inhibitor Maf [Clostridia bacterium]